MPDDTEKGEYGPITDPKEYLRAKKMDLDAEAQKLAVETELKRLS